MVEGCKITVLAEEEGEWYSDDNVSGTTTNVTLTDGTTTVRVDGVLTMEDEDDEEAMQEMFACSVELAEAGVEGYTLL